MAMRSFAMKRVRLDATHRRGRGSVGVHDADAEAARCGSRRQAPAVLRRVGSGVLGPKALSLWPFLDPLNEYCSPRECKERMPG
jgi:hypothetical protein